MYILAMDGSVLATFDKWDIKSVVYAERWIKVHCCFIFKYESINGNTYITVKHY